MKAGQNRRRAGRLYRRQLAARESFKRRLREETEDAGWRRSRPIRPTDALLACIIGAKHAVEVGTTGYCLCVAEAFGPEGNLGATSARNDWTAAATGRKLSRNARAHHRPALKTLTGCRPKASPASSTWPSSTLTRAMTPTTSCLKLICRGGLILIDNVLWAAHREPRLTPTPIRSEPRASTLLMRRERRPRRLLRRRRRACPAPKVAQALPNIACLTLTPGLMPSRRKKAPLIRTPHRNSLRMVSVESGVALAWMPDGAVIAMKIMSRGFRYSSSRS